MSRVPPAPCSATPGEYHHYFAGPVDRRIADAQREAARAGAFATIRTTAAGRECCEAPDCNRAHRIRECSLPHLLVPTRACLSAASASKASSHGDSRAWFTKRARAPCAIGLNATPARGRRSARSSTSRQPAAYSRRRMGAISPSASQPPCVSVTRVPASVGANSTSTHWADSGSRPGCQVKRRRRPGSTDSLCPSDGARRRARAPRPRRRRRVDWQRVAALRESECVATGHQSANPAANASKARSGVDGTSTETTTGSMPLIPRSIRPVQRLETKRQRGGADGFLPTPHDGRRSPRIRRMDAVAALLIVVFQLLLRLVRGSTRSRAACRAVGGPPPIRVNDRPPFSPCRGCARAGRGSCATASARGRRPASGNTRRWCAA